jgi:hypothetical protein
MDGLKLVMINKIYYKIGLRVSATLLLTLLLLSNLPSVASKSVDPSAKDYKGAKGVYDLIIGDSNEPSIFRRSYFLALDWIGDTGAILVGGSEETMPAFPHLIIEDCILAGYSVFATGEEGKAVSYTTKGKVQTYVQFNQFSKDSNGSIFGQHNCLMNQISRYSGAFGL